MRRKKGTPFAVAIMGTRRGPEVFANGRTLRTARSGGRQLSLSFGGDIGAGHTLGRGVRVTVLESWGTNCFRMAKLALLPLDDASTWSSVYANQLVGIEAVMFLITSYPALKLSPSKYGLCKFLFRRNLLRMALRRETRSSSGSGAEEHRDSRALYRAIAEGH